MLIALLASCGIENLVRGQDREVVDPVVVIETFEQVPHAKVDLLFVIDDTGSMAEEQAALSEAFASFVGAIDELGLAWQIGVVTTASSGDSAGVLQGDPWIITAAAADPVEALAEAVDVGTDGVEEAGLTAMRLALSDPLISEENRGFRRGDAALHVVILSDDDDSGDDVGVAIDFLEDQAANGYPAQLSAVVGDVPGGCRGPGGEAFPGTDYAAVAGTTGGTVGSICEPDLEEIAASIAELSAHYPTTFELQAVPASSPRVAIDDARQDSGWSLEGSAVVFETPPPAGSTVEVRYELATQ